MTMPESTTITASSTVTWPVTGSTSTATAVACDPNVSSKFMWPRSSGTGMVLPGECTTVVVRPGSIPAGRRCGCHHASAAIGGEAASAPVRARMCAAIASIFVRSSVAARVTAPPAITAVRLPHEPMPYGSAAVSPSLTVMCASSMPSTSAATWASVVSCPWPCDFVPTATVTLPSGSTETGRHLPRAEAPGDAVLRRRAALHEHRDADPDVTARRRAPPAGAARHSS